MAPPLKRGSFQGSNKSPSQILSKCSNTSTTNNNVQGGAEDTSGETAGGEDAAEADHSADADGPAPGMAKPARRRSLATSEMGDDESMSGALEQKMAELEASGWRPEEDNNFDVIEDDDYKSVENLSDWDGEDVQLRRQEEKMMWTGDRDDGSLGADDEETLARRLSLSSTSSDLAYLAFNDDNYLFSETAFDQSVAHLDPDHLLLDADLIFGDKTPLARQTSHESSTTQRRVRFQDELDMSDGNSSDSDQDNDFFPDLFVQQDHLDPTFRAMIEDDHDLYMDDDSDAASCWDFEADEMRLLDMDDEDDDDSDSDSSAGSSGYESDDGDTTDEEAPPPPPKVEKAVEKEPSPVSSSGSNAATPKAARAAVPRQRAASKRATLVKQPKRGVFIMDPTRAVLTIEGAGKNQKHQFWPAKIQSDADLHFWQRLKSLANSRASSRNTSPRMSVQLTPTDEGGPTPGRHLSIDSGSNAFFDESGALLADQILGPAEAFLPFTSVSAGGDITFDDANQATTGDEEEQDPLSFLDFGSDEDEDDEMPDESDSLMSPSTSASFPHFSGTTKSPGFDLLAHLDAHRGVVGSFRRNQQFARHVGSLPSHPAMRASTSESNAMQTGRRAAANTPITPLRKKKTAKAVVGARNSPITSPLNKSPPLKRKGPVRGGFSGRR
ncbi:hypothetical protein MBLNU459_g6043t1 [Dothideomycetes sp. NU459]